MQESGVSPLAENYTTLSKLGRRGKFMRLLTLLLVLFATTGPAAAGPLEDGLAAFEANDYTTALRLLRPLADQGDMVAAAR